MNDFEFQCATKMIFGKDKELCVGEEPKKHGAARVLFVYGGTSVKSCAYGNGGDQTAARPDQGSRSPAEPQRSRGWER